MKYFNALVVFPLSSCLIGLFIYLYINESKELPVIKYKQEFQTRYVNSIEFKEPDYVIKAIRDPDNDPIVFSIPTEGYHFVILGNNANPLLSTDFVSIKINEADKDKIKIGWIYENHKFYSPIDK